jgi:hypothetical protein
VIAPQAPPERRMYSSPPANCHALTVAFGNVSGLSVVNSLGLIYQGTTVPVVSDGVERRAHEWICWTCRKRLCVDEARLRDV